MRLLIGQLDSKGRDDVADHAIVQVEQLRLLTIIAITPQTLRGSDIDQADVDSNFPLEPAHVALQYVACMQFLSDLIQFYRLILVGKYAVLIINNS